MALKREQTARLQFWLITLLVILLIGLLAYLSQRHTVAWDLTASGRNSLSEISKEILARLKGPVQIKVFIGEAEELRLPIRRFVDRYRRVKGDIELLFVNPDLHPEEVRRLGIQRPGEVVVQYGGRWERIEKLSEKELTSAFLRLLKRGELEIAFLTGHGERSPSGQANFDLGRFGRALQAEGYRIRRCSLADTGCPGKADLLVVASPQVDWLPAELQKLKRLLDRGVNLLWLFDPGKPYGFAGFAGFSGFSALSEALGIKILPGVLVDPEGRSLLGLNDPTFLVVASYPDHPIVRDFDQVTLFPGAASLQGSQGWSPILMTSPSAWNETDLSKEILTLDGERGERIGPHIFGLALEREGKQRLVVIGDGDFLANAFIGNGGNLDLGLRIVRWLTHQDTLIEISRPRPPDAYLQLTSVEVTLIATTAMLLPLLYLGIGAFVWWRRRS